MRQTIVVYESPRIGGYPSPTRPSLKVDQESVETFQPSLRCSPLPGLQKAELLEAGVENTDPFETRSPLPSPAPPLLPTASAGTSQPPPLDTAAARPSSVPAPIRVAVALPVSCPLAPSVAPEGGLGLAETVMLGAVAAGAAAAVSALRRWCHSAHDVVGKARLSHGISSHRTAIT